MPGPKKVRRGESGGAGGAGKGGRAGWLEQADGDRPAQGGGSHADRQAHRAGRAAGNRGRVARRSIFRSASSSDQGLIKDSMKSTKLSYSAFSVGPA